VSAARTAPSEACWSGPQVPWKVEVADWYTISCAPRSVSTRDMSGNADSKQISTPIGSGFPVLSVACSRCAPVPGIILDGAALLILVNQQVGTVLFRQRLHFLQLGAVLGQGQV